MKKERRTLILYAIALAVLIYSFWELSSFGTSVQARACCRYQNDCAENMVCKTIYPYCDESPWSHICELKPPGGGGHGGFEDPLRPTF